LAKFAALPLFTDAWVADTKHLSRLERGTYHDLLVLMWRTPECRVPNDDDWLSKRLGLTPFEVEKELRPLIEEFCQGDGNWIFQKRLIKEFRWCAKNRHSQSVRAKSRWDKEKNNAHAYAEPQCPLPYPTLPKDKKNNNGHRIYFFESGSIQLNEKDFKKWEASFSKLDLKAELIQLTKWAGEQGNNWFHAVAGALAKRNRIIKADADRPQSKDVFSGIT
jgi:uncharacterized protein YdaU (DUF1376 family)